MTGPGEEDDAALVARARAGDQRAFSGLMERYREPLYRLVRRYVDGSDDAYDILQQTFVAAWRSLHRYDPARPFGAWTRTIALNKCRDWSRRRAVRRLLLLEGPQAEAMESAPDPQQSVEAALVRQEEEAALARELAGLPRGLKEALILTAVDGLSHAQTGDVLGVTAKAVESRVYRARKELARRMRKARAPLG